MPSNEYRDLLKDAWDLHVSKNAGYAGAENPDPWANFRLAETFGVSALDGALVRMSDKFIRVGNLRKNPLNDQVGESIRDTLKDLAAYALISVCLLDEELADQPIAMSLSESAPPTKFLCGHNFGEEPNPMCGTAIHWSRVNGIELTDDISASD